MTPAAPWQPRTLAGDPALTWHDPEPLRIAGAPVASAGGIHVVLLHGITRCGRDFEPLVASLTATHEATTVDGHGPRLAVLDHRGHGDSSRASRYLVTDYAADAARFLEAHGPCVVVGHSLGAMVAAAVAAELPSTMWATLALVVLAATGSASSFRMATVMFRALIHLELGTSLLAISPWRRSSSSAEAEEVVRVRVPQMQEAALLAAAGVSRCLRFRLLRLEQL